MSAGGLLWKIEIEATKRAELVAGAWLLLDAPMYIANKANLGDTDRRRGGPGWREVQSFEASIRLAALAALRSAGLELWPRDAYGYQVDVVLEFGARAHTVKATPRRKAHTRISSAPARSRAYGVDSIKSVLDALEGSIYTRDELATRSSSRKMAAPTARIGDRVAISVALHEERPT